MSEDDTTRRPEDIAAMRLASSALSKTRTGDSHGAIADLEELRADCGQNGLLVALLCWADTVNYAVGAAEAVTQGFTIGVFGTNSPGGQLDLMDIDTAPPWVRWAVRFIAARAAMNFEQCSALMESLTTGEQTKECFCGVLQVAAETLNMHGIPAGRIERWAP